MSNIARGMIVHVQYLWWGFTSHSTLQIITWIFAQSIKYPETPLNSARRAEIWLPRGCPGGKLLRVRLRLFMIMPAIEYKQRSGLRCAIHATRGRLQSVQVVRENDNTSRTSPKMRCTRWYSRYKF